MASEITNLYFVGCPGHVKIGVADDVDARIAQLQTGNPHTLELLAVMENVPRRLERRVHDALRKSRVAGEWFRLDKKCRKFVLLVCSGARPTTTQEIKHLLKYAPASGMPAGPAVGPLTFGAGPGKRKTAYPAAKANSSTRPLKPPKDWSPEAPLDFVFAVEPGAAPKTRARIVELATTNAWLRAEVARLTSKLEKA